MERFSQHTVPLKSKLPVASLGHRVLRNRVLRYRNGVALDENRVAGDAIRFSREDGNLLLSGIVVLISLAKSFSLMILSDQNVSYPWETARVTGRAIMPYRISIGLQVLIEGSAAVSCDANNRTESM